MGSKTMGFGKCQAHAGLPKGFGRVWTGEGELIEHPWFTPPDFVTRHTKLVCPSCNNMLIPEHFWGTKGLDNELSHILPCWEDQLRYIRLRYSLKWDTYKERVQLIKQMIEQYGTLYPPLKEYLNKCLPLKLVKGYHAKINELP